MQNNSDIVNILLSDKCHFHVSGYVNKQNCHYWAPNNPNKLHWHPLHSAKVIVCCAVSSHGIILEECGQAYSNCECRAVQSCWKHFCTMSFILITKICCSYNMMQKLLTQHKFPCKSSGQCFWAFSFLIAGTSPGPPTCLTFQYQTTSSRSTLKTWYMKHVLPKLMT